MIKAYPPKDPDSRLPHWFDASGLVADEGSPVASYALAIDVAPDAALTLADDSRDGSVVSYFPIGGTIGQEYTIRCRFTLENGCVEDMSRTLLIEQH